MFIEAFMSWQIGASKNYDSVEMNNILREQMMFI